MLNKQNEHQRSSFLIVFPWFGAVNNDNYAALVRANQTTDTVGAVGDLIRWLNDEDLHSKETYCTSFTVRWRTSHPKKKSVRT